MLEDPNVSETNVLQAEPVAQARPTGRAKRKIPLKAPRVFVLDDDDAEVQAIKAVLEEEKFFCATFTHPQECIESVKNNGCDVLLCDLVMLEMDGHQVFAEVKGIRPDIPVIFVTGHGSIPVAVTATKNGAANFIEKPFDRATLIESIRMALRDANKAWTRFPIKLSKTEKLILKHVLRGNGNRHIAQKLGKSVRTVEDHRSHLMRKMGVDNIVDLVKRAIELGLDNEPGSPD